MGKHMPPRTERAHLIVSCLFGTDFDAVYPAIPGQRCVFFTDKPALQTHIREMGWECVLWKPDEISKDILCSSLQSKWVKFLKFLDSFDNFSCFQSITYVDHKFSITHEHINWILNNRDEAKDVLIRETPLQKETLSAEIDAARGQERYERHMQETRAYLYALISNGLISENIRIMNTGLIHYINPTNARPLSDAVYEACWRLKQPECQILWAALSQIHPVKVQRVAWEALNPLWAAPERPTQI